jgi:hypothetical protein
MSQIMKTVRFYLVSLLLLIACSLPLPSQVATNGVAQLLKHEPRPLTESEANQVREQGLEPRGMIIDASLPVLRAPTQAEIEKLRGNGVDVDKLPPQLLFAADDQVAAMHHLIEQAKVAAGDNASPDLKNAMICMDSFMGETNATIAADVISMKTDSLNFYLLGKTWDYSGHYTVVLNKPRAHKKPYFGFGSVATAAFVFLDNFGGTAMSLPSATIWEKTKGFIVVEAGGKEWIHSGGYTIRSQ